MTGANGSKSLNILILLNPDHEFFPAGHSNIAVLGPCEMPGAKQLYSNLQRAATPSQY
jgi:hypothetical protein